MRCPPSSPLFPYTTLFRSAGDPAQVLEAGPPAILLGEVRLAVPVVAQVDILSQAGPIALTGASLAPSIAGLTVRGTPATDRKSTRLNSSHVEISYAVFCLK